MANILIVGPVIQEGCNIARQLSDTLMESKESTKEGKNKSAIAIGSKHREHRRTIDLFSTLSAS